MYHMEVRQFPHNVCRFNLTEVEVQVVVVPWSQKEWVEVGERKWSPHQARLTIVEGPALPMAQLTMGRGWRAAEREGTDVTEKLLAAAGRAVESAPSHASGSDGGGLIADPLAFGVQIASLLGSDPLRLLEAWRSVAASSPGLAPSESLAVAERTLEDRGGSAG